MSSSGDLRGSNKLGVAGAQKFISWLKSKPDIEIAVMPSCSNPFSILGHEEAASMMHRQ